jgi:hypothetical protein
MAAAKNRYLSAYSSYLSLKKYHFVVILLLAFSGLLPKLILPVISFANNLLLAWHITSPQSPLNCLKPCETSLFSSLPDMYGSSSPHLT